MKLSLEIYTNYVEQIKINTHPQNMQEFPFPISLFHRAKKGQISQVMYLDNECLDQTRGNDIRRNLQQTLEPK